MLDHRQLYVVGSLGKLGLALGDVGKIDLLVFVGFGINRRAGEGRNHHRLALRGLVVALQLVVSVRVERLAGGVADFQATSTR